MADRATHALGKHVWAPAWDAACAPNRDGFCLGRRTWDAIGALAVQSNQQPNGVVEADSATGCDRIPHEAVVRQRDAPPTLSRQSNAGLQGGVLDKGIWCPTAAGTPHGGPVSPV
jgi:retron-type reverse transcriptase